MRRREDHALEKHTINFYRGDYQKIQNLYPKRIGAAKVIRDVIHAHIRLIEENAAQRIPYHTYHGVDLDELDDLEDAI